jgi:hypothetical protein
VARTTLASLGAALSSLASSVTLYAAPCLSAGAVTATLHHPLQLDLAMAFTLGFFFPIGPIYWAYATGWGMRRTLSQIREWEQAGLLTTTEGQKLRSRALAWFAARRFGK